MNDLIDRNNITKDTIYNPMDSAVATDEMNKVIRLLQGFLELSKLSMEDIRINDALVLKSVIRIDQRSDYFTYFHSEIDKEGKVIIDEMSQYKQIALLCFWIIKYKPFSIKDDLKELDYYSQNKCMVNESFAAYLFITYICNSKMVNRKQEKYYMSRDYLKDLCYKFMHHDISKESMIFALCTSACCK